MAHAGPDFYDDDAVFATYQGRRQRQAAGRAGHQNRSGSSAIVLPQPLSSALSSSILVLIRR